MTKIEAWKVYKRLASDDRIQVLPEPLGIERAWYELTTFGQQVIKLWTDAYLQAFGRLRGAQVVTFDRGF